MAQGLAPLASDVRNKPAPAAPTLEQLRERPHLSVSALKLYLSCPKKFGFRYCSEEQPTHTPVALPFGRAFHDVVGFTLIQAAKGRLLTDGDKTEYFADALRRELSDNRAPVLFDDEEDEQQLLRKGAAMLHALFAAVGIPERVLHVELPFAIDVHDPDTGELLPVELIGAVDAVVVEEGRVTLWELKSGKRRWPEAQVLYDLQNTAYWLALRNKYPDIDLKLVICTKSERPDVQVERLRRGRSDERDLLATAASVHRAVTAGCFHPVRSWACKTCEYGETCE